MINFINRGAIAPLLLMMALSSYSFADNMAEKKVEEVKSNHSLAWYGGLGYTTAKATCTDGCEDITYGFLGRVGYDFSNYLGGELRVLKTFLEYEQQKIEHAGVFLKPMYPISKNMSIYALLGFGKISTGDKIVYDDSGIAWGLGLNYYFGEKNSNSKDFGVFIDYERLLQKSDAPDFDTFTFGAIYSF